MVPGRLCLPNAQRAQMEFRKGGVHQVPGVVDFAVANQVDEVSHDH